MSSTNSSNSTTPESAACTPAVLDSSQPAKSNVEYVKNRSMNLTLATTRVKGRPGFLLQFTPIHNPYENNVLNLKKNAIVSVYGATEDEVYQKAAFWMKTPRTVDQDKYRL